MKIPKWGVLRAATVQFITAATFIPAFLKPALIGLANQIPYQKGHGGGFHQGGQ